jgi:hypothetical protein
VLKVLLVVVLFAVVTYAVFRLLERRSGSGTGAPGGPSRSPRGTAPRQVAPDDDEDFLRWLDRKRRKDPPG